MKFKLIFVVFNILILLSFAVVLIMPVMMLGPDYSMTLWSTNWYLPVLFLLVIIAIDAYFFINWQLFSLLEAENWTGLVNFLEEKVLRRGKFQANHVRTLIQAYFVTGNVSKLEPLEAMLREKRPKLVKKFALELGMPKVLHKDHADMVDFFGEFRGQKVPNEQWVRFLHAFGVLMQKEHSEGREELLVLAREVKEPLLKVLVLYTLDPFRTIDDEVLDEVDKQKGEMAGKFTEERLLKELDRNRGNIATVVMAPLIKDSITWLFKAAGKESE